MAEEVAEGGKAVGDRSKPYQMICHHLKEVLNVAEEQVIFVAIVRIESRTANARPVQHVQHSDFLERFLVHQFDQGVAEHISRAADTAIGLPSLARCGGSP